MIELHLRGTDRTHMMRPPGWWVHDPAQWYQSTPSHRSTQLPSPYNHWQAKPALATEPLLNDAPAPAHEPEPPTNAANQQEGGAPAPSSPPAPVPAPPTADAASADATAAVAAGEGKEEEALAGPRRPVLLEDAAAFKAFFLRPPVKEYVLGHYKQKMLLEVCACGNAFASGLGRNG